MKVTKIFNQPDPIDDEKQDHVIITDIPEFGRRDSTLDQLKDLTGVANALGCYDGADFLREHIEKIEKKEEPINIALCCKCSDKMVQPDMLDQSCSYIAGCKRMTKQEWDSNKPCPATGFPRK